MRLKYIPFSLWLVAAHAQNINVQVSGRSIGAESTLNLMPGAGILHVCSDNKAQHRVDCTPSFNTAVVPTHETIHANENYCVSSTRTTSYVCRLPNSALTSYRAGMTFVLNVDTDCLRDCTLNIDNVNPTNIKKADGSSDPGGALAAGQPQWIFYDGTVFRLMGGGGSADGGSGKDQRGDVRARRLISSMDSLPYQAAMTLDVTAGDVHKIRTAPSAGNATLHAATGGLPGQHLWIIIANDNTSAKTITFGGNLLNTGPLAGAVGKSATIHFVSDGTAWYEVSRTAGL
jgi:hypothetical protein